MSVTLHIVIAGVFLFKGCFANAQDTTLVLRIVNESTTPVYSTYMTPGRYGHPNNLTDHFKSEIIDNWESYGITKVNVSVKVGNQEVFYLHFDVSNTNKMSWFSISNLVRSFPDVNLNATYRTPTSRQLGKYFHITTEVNRIFVVNHYYNGCPGDVGWLMIFDTQRKAPCLFESQNDKDKVIILFSPYPHPAYWEQIYRSSNGRADFLDIYANASDPGSCIKCVCPRHMDNITKEELAEVIKKLKEELTVDKTKTSANIRRKISASDPRPSAKALGSVGAAMLAIPFVFIILCDMISLFQYRYR